MIARDIGSRDLHRRKHFDCNTFLHVPNQVRLRLFSTALTLLIVFSIVFPAVGIADSRNTASHGSNHPILLGNLQNGASCRVLVNLRLRSGPSLSHSVVKKLEGNPTIYPIGRNSNGTWIEVIEEGTAARGWVNANPEYVSCRQPIANLPISSSGVEASAPNSIDPPPVDISPVAPHIEPALENRAAVVAMPPAAAPAAMAAVVAAPATAPIAAVVQSVPAQSQPVQFVGLPSGTVAALPQRNLPTVPSTDQANLTGLSQAQIDGMRRVAGTYGIIVHDGYSQFRLDESRLAVFSDALNIGAEYFELTSFAPTSASFAIHQTTGPGGKLGQKVFSSTDAGNFTLYCAFVVTGDTCKSVSLETGSVWPFSGTAITNGYYALSVMLNLEESKYSWIMMDNTFYFAIASPHLQPASFVTEINRNLPASAQIVLPSTVSQPAPAQAAPAQQPAAAQPAAVSAGQYFRGSATVSCASDGRVRFEGTVTHNGQPVNGVQIGFKSRLVEGTTPVVRPETSGPSDLRPNWANGYYESIVDGNAATAKDKHLEIWLLNSAGERISDYVHWDTAGSTGTCNTATINFTSP